jgi:para-aminobenzoate synthetase component 1
MLATIITRAAVQAMTKRRRKTRQDAGLRATVRAIVAARLRKSPSRPNRPERPAGADLASLPMSLGRVLAALPATDAATVVQDGSRTVVAFGAADELTAPAEPFTALDTLGGGWWAGFATYELGHRVEHVSQGATNPHAGRRDSTHIPELAFVRFAARVEVAPDGSTSWSGTGAARRALERSVAEPAAATSDPLPRTVWPSSLDRFDFESRVRTIQDLIRAGECYQVNLTRRLDGPATDPVALWDVVTAGNPAPHAMFWRDGRGFAVVSASPERYLGVDGPAVETRPIKGTATSAEQLLASAKDRAENVMIVDLARNDLGRVCVPGTIHVVELCGVEPHPGLVHLVSTVRGRRRPDVGFGGLLRATFPPASITGAPKPRVMQAIEDLEPVRRGVYCGATGWIDADADRADLAVAIRTFTCTPDATTFGVGSGITIDSDPAAEWAETELKAARLLHLAGAADEPALVEVST